MPMLGNAAASLSARLPGASARLGLVTPLGWEVSPPLTVVSPVAGIRLSVRAGDAAEVLGWIAWRWNKYVEPLVAGQCGGYNRRVNVNRRAVWSEHAAGTAIDLNWRLHPNGHRPSASMVAGWARAVAPAAQWGVFRWGGEYRSTPDPMHVELLHRPPEIAALARKLRSDRT